MGWSVGYDSDWDRDIGYGVPAYCDHPKCNEGINRGLSYVCGDDPYGGDKGCGLYFCSDHLYYHSFIDGDLKQVCLKCHTYKRPYKPKGDHPDWIKHKMTDDIWADWRIENPKWVKEN